MLLLQSSVFISGDLTLQCGFLNNQEMTSSTNKIRKKKPHCNFRSPLNLITIRLGFVFIYINQSSERKYDFFDMLTNYAQKQIEILIETLRYFMASELLDHFNFSSESPRGATFGVR
jgi:hypothetical protein